MSKAPVKVIPSQCTQLRATAVTATTVVLAWKAPITGTKPFGFTVFVRVHGTTAWAVGATGSTTSATVSKLRAGTQYEFEVMAHNQ